MTFSEFCMFIYPYSKYKAKSLHVHVPILQDFSTGCSQYYRSGQEDWWWYPNKLNLEIVVQERMVVNPITQLNHSSWQKGLKSLKRLLSFLLHLLTSETATLSGWLTQKVRASLETENQITPGTNVRSLISSLSVGHAIWLQNTVQFEASVQETIAIGITKVW